MSAHDPAAYDRADLLRAAEAGIRAPSLHNSQPWLFRLRDGAIEVLTDPTRRVPPAEQSGWAARIAAGAAAFNARLALTEAGRPPVVELHPALVRLSPGPARPATYTEHDLHAAIARRYSNRSPFWPDPVPAEVRAQMIEAARAEGAWLDLLVGTTAVAGFAEIARSADRVLRRDGYYQSELTRWADAVPATAGAPPAEPQDLLPQRLFNDRRRAPGRDYEPEPLIGILGVTGDRPIDQTAAGLALQRVLLTATAASIDTSMISQPIEVPAARDQLRRSLGRPGFPQIAIRFGYGTPGRPTPRRPVDEVLTT
jgi:nitroreductase